MVKYKCSKCDKIFTHKSKYIRHLNRKYSCDANLILTEKDLIKNGDKIPIDNSYDDFTVPQKKNAVPYHDFAVPDVASAVPNVASTVPKNNGHLNKKNKKFSCEYCHKTFKQKRYLVEHIKKYCKMNSNINSIYNNIISLL